LGVLEKGYCVHIPTIHNISHLSLILSFMVELYMFPLKVHLSIVSWEEGVSKLGADANGK